MAVDSVRGMERFFCLPDEYASSDGSLFVIQRVPFEGTVSYGTGTSKGPQAVLRASAEVELFDDELEAEPYLDGIMTDEPIEVADGAEGMAEALAKRTKPHIEAGRIPMTLGGEHSITLGEVRAMQESYPDMCVLQIDAHADLRESFDGDRYSHACVMRRILELGVPAVQVGIRSMAAEEHDVRRQLSTKIYPASFVHSTEDWIAQVVSSLGEHVFITIDVDGLDTSIMPATGTPEPGGLTWQQVTGLLRRVCASKDIVGCDIVEFSPIKGMHAYEYTVARLLYKLIGYISEGRRHGAYR